MRSRRFRRRWRLAVVALLAVVVAVLAYGYGETYWIDVKDYTFTSPDVPVSFDGTRIVFVTDIHRGPFFSENRVRSLVERVNALEPDLVVLGGDYVYKGTGYAESCFKELEALSAPLGTYGVLGNHDYGDYKKGEDGPNPVIKAMSDAGITLLRDDAVWIEKDGARIRLGGVSDSQIDRPRFNATVQGTTKDDFVILVSHEPDYAEKLPADAVDLVLSGHTHGGQVAIFGKWAFYVPSDYGQKYRTGMVKNDVTTVIVSNGIGTSTIPPIRISVRPQIVAITLERGTATSGGD
jgi:predicted MPP superfamily phosphohydrolase